MKPGNDDIALFFENYRNAAWEKDLEAMLSLYDKNVIIYDMWNDLFVAGIDAWKKLNMQWFDSLQTEKVKVGFHDMHLEKDRELATAHGFISFQAIAESGEVLRGMKNRVSLVFKKHADVWKVIHQHTSIPIRSSDTTGIFVS